MKHNSRYGVLLIFGSVIVFSVMSGFVKLLPHINSTTVSFYRFAIGLGILGALSLSKILKLKFNNFRLLFLRGLSGGLAVFILYLSIVKLGLGKASVYNYSYPIFSSILSAIFFKEKIPAGKWLLIIAAFFGIVILSLNFDNGNNFFGEFSFYELLAILGAISAAFSIVLVKKLHDTDDSYAIFFAQTIVGFWIFIGPGMTGKYDGSFSDGIILLFIGILAMSGQLLMTEGYKYTTITTGSSLALIIPVLNSIIGILFYKEFFSTSEIIGSSIVITCCFCIIIFERIKNKIIELQSLFH